MKSLSALAGLLGLAAAQSWPNTPFTASGRDILDASGNVVTFAGANWPGAADVMIPEGLQYQSVSYIVSKLKEIGMNAVRLTYAIEMIDQIYDNGGVDIPLSQALTQALGEANGTAVFNQILAANPDFSTNITRLGVFDAVAAGLAAEEIYIDLDNHMSQGAWCCNTEDGNSWWGDTYFSVANWTRGLAYMADHASSWTALTSMSLRNEPRRPDNNATLAETYNWQYWYDYVKEGAAAVSTANPDALVILSGLDFDTFLTPVVRGTALTPGTGTFSRADFAADKVVLELHNYANSVADCASLESSLYNNGFEALNTTADVNHFPVLLTEWGFAQDGSTYLKPYTQCLAEYLPAQKAGWMIWVVAGSYYIRSGTQDYEETWGLLSHDWSDWRDPAFVNSTLAPMVEATLS
ncbi:beta-galactanase [Diaporthe eres]|uniref:Glycoside hydrolase family 5 domain-containing protein n=1 Tax=Diaporthe vaccinii TaxID=105482 RepID=A0ABR4ETU0_9PEZI|nr:beta-galactanase [Diaporthe eres]